MSLALARFRSLGLALVALFALSGPASAATPEPPATEETTAAEPDPPLSKKARAKQRAREQAQAEKAKQKARNQRKKEKERKKKQARNGTKGGNDESASEDTPGSEPPPSSAKGYSLPAGYIDSPFVVPDGSALYFLHSPVPPNQIGQPNAKPACPHLPGHMAADDPVLWFNTDLYVAKRKGDAFGAPVNLGPRINTKHLECCPWVSTDQRVLIFTREGLGDDSATGNYIARRSSPDAPWGEPERLEGPIGQYMGSNGIHDLHLTPSGDVWAWSEKDGGRLFHANPAEANGMADKAGSTGARLRLETARKMDFKTPARWKDSQPWLSQDEKILAFNRWEDASRELWIAIRKDRNSPWSDPGKVGLRGFEDPAGNAVWGEPSFSTNGLLYFVRFDTSKSDWPAELRWAPPNEDGSYGPSYPVTFR